MHISNSDALILELISTENEDTLTCVCVFL